MPKYGQYQFEKPRKDEKKNIHPIWRGIGCVMMVVIPVLSYFAAIQLLNMHGKLSWVIIPEDIVFSTMKDPLILVKAIYTIIIALLLFLLMGIITFVINRFFGPSKYGPYDVKN